MAAVSWTEKEYALADVKDMTLPCVVKVTEGYHGEGESDTFSRDDIIKIDEYTVLQKVKANFVADSDGNKLMYKDDIQIPLNYKGKLRIIQPAREYSNIAELADGSPRYAKFQETVKVPIPYAGGGQMIQANDVAEIDRVLPAKQGKETSLIMTVGGKTIQLPLNFKAKSMAVADENEYTLQEVIDRYSLPRTIQFLDDKVKEVFARNLRDGVGNMSHITGTLRIKELTQQEVLIGHFKGEEIADDAVTAIVRRSVVVIPLKEFGDTGIQILEEKNKSDYEIFVASSFSRTQGIKFVDGSLYAEFTRRPMVYKIPETVDEADEVADSGSCVPPVKGDTFTPPRLPPRPEFQPRLNQASVTGYRKRTGVGTKTTPLHHQAPVPVPVSPTKFSAPQSMFKADPEVNLPPAPPPPRGRMVPAPLRPPPASDLNKDDNDDEDGYEIMQVPYSEYLKRHVGQEPSGTSGSTGHKYENTVSFKGKFTKWLHKKSKPKDERSYGQSFETPVLSGGGLHEDPDYEIPVINTSVTSGKRENTDSLYEEPDSITPGLGSHPLKSERHTAPVQTVKPICVRQVSGQKVKPVSELSVLEMEERLKICGLDIFASVCKEHKLDGDFIVTLDKADLAGDPFNLSKFDIKKLERMIEKNWIPNEG